MRRKIFITTAINQDVHGAFLKKNAEEAVRAYEAGSAIVYVYTGNLQAEETGKKWNR